MKNTKLKKIQFAALVSIASAMGMQEGQSFRMHCPAPETLTMESVGQKIRFTGEASANNEIPPIQLKSETFRPKVPMAPKDLHYQNMHIEHRGPLVCAYQNPPFRSSRDYLPLVGSLPEGVTCHNVDISPDHRFVECEKK